MVQKNDKYYNHSLYIKKIYDENNKLDLMYLTNNIEESLHLKISYFLQKNKINRYNFIKCIENLLFNDYLKCDEIIRHDDKTKAYILLIEKEKLNIQPK